MLYSQLRVSEAERDFRYPSLIQNWPICTFLCQKQVKTAAKLKNNAGWAPFLGVTLSFEACNHIIHCVKTFRGRCQYVESDTRVQMYDPIKSPKRWSQFLNPCSIIHADCRSGIRPSEDVLIAQGDLTSLFKCESCTKYIPDIVR